MKENDSRIPYCRNCNLGFNPEEIRDSKFCPKCGMLLIKKRPNISVLTVEESAGEAGNSTSDLGDWLKTMVERYQSTTKIPEEGRWKHMNSDQLWRDLILAITYIGASKPGEKLRDSPDIERLSIENMATLTPKTINDIFADYSIRYVSREVISNKAKWVYENYRNPEIVESGRFVLFEKLPQLKNTVPEQRLEIERKARSIVNDTVKGFGNKNTSDYLTGRGYARHLAVMDTRVSNLLAEKLGGDPKSYTTPEFYEEWEEFLISRDLTSAVVDRVLYQNYDQIVTHLE